MHLNINNNNINNPLINNKELSYIIKQKLKEINQIKNIKEEEKSLNQGQKQNQNKSQKWNQINQNKINENKNIDISFKILREEEKNKKASLNPLFSKDINLSSTNQSNTLTNISNLFGSVFQGFLLIKQIPLFISHKKIL